MDVELGLGQQQQRRTSTVEQPPPPPPLKTPLLDYSDHKGHRSSRVRLLMDNMFYYIY